MTVHSPADHFLARYEGLTRRLPGDKALRERAADILRRFGLPSRREEDWKYTSLAAIAETDFHEPLTDATGEAGVDLPDLSLFAGMPRLVFVQGRFDKIHSQLPDTITIQGFSGAAEPHSLVNPERDRVAALNTMLAEDGALLDVPADTDAGAILVVSLGRDINGTPVGFHPRHRIRLAAGATLTVIDIFSGHGEYLHNPVSEIEIGAGATLTHIRAQTESSAAFHLATLYVDVAERGTYDSFTLSAGGRIARTEIHARLHGSQAHIALNAAQVLRGTQHSDFTTVVSHDAPNCTSRQTVKHVLSDRARGVFQGTIEVARAAQKTDGYQMNQALLLSPGAEIDCKPQLRIYADDVKCSHGATVGELDAEQLFYLASRGIPKEDAKTMLIRAFLAEAMDFVTHAGARTLLEQTIDRHWLESGT